MLLALLICSFTLCSATPFHKYPFVFLLDVGNEELGKANSEQIKVSVPGGVLALKYPAVSDGPVIGHIRVTGIDFGIDLKASIVEGGPGYRYVVIVLMGAPGKQYDSVVTIQTLDEDTQQVKSISDGYKVQEDSNDSAEELEESYNIMYSKKMSAEITQSDSIAYEENESLESQDGDNENEQNSNEDEVNSDTNEDNSYKSNQDTQQTNSNVYQSNTNYNLLAESQQESKEEFDDEQEFDKIKEKILSNSDSKYVSVIPFNVLAGYGRFKSGFYGDIMAYPRVVPHDKSLIDRETDHDYSVHNKDLNNNIDDYASSVEN